MASVSQNPNYLYRKNFKQGSILFAVLLFSTLSSYILASYIFLSQKHYVKKYLISNLIEKKQALFFAHAAFMKLKAHASDDRIVTYEEKDKFCFFDPVKNVRKTLEKNFHNLLGGYKVTGIFQVSKSFNCCHDHSGLKTSIDTYLSTSAKNEPLSIFPLAQQRWQALKTQFLPLHLFPPILKSITCNKSTNPYTLNYTLNFSYPYENHSTPENELTVFIGNVKTSLVLTGDSTTITDKYFGANFLLRIVNGWSYSIPLYTTDTTPFSINITYSGDPTSGFTCCTTSNKTYTSKWRKHQPTPVVNTSYSTPEFSVKTWVDKINACFYQYKEREPFNKINNFGCKHDTTKKLQQLFWDHVVVDETAPRLCFNGPFTHLKEWCSACGIDVTESVLQHILAKQPYESPTIFLKHLYEMPLCEQIYLQFFKNLSHRTECFKIVSWYQNITCEMIVRRDATSATERTWTIESVCFFKRKVKNAIL